MLRLAARFGILPIDVEPIEAEVFDEGHGGGGEFLAPGSAGCRQGEVGGVGPTAD